MKKHLLRRAHLSAVAIGVSAFAANTYAVELDTGDPDWAVRLDNTIKASTIYRTEGANPALVNSFIPGTHIPQALNFNAGNDNFRNRGFVSKRLDLLTEFDAVYQKNFGLRLSTAAWSDASYRGKTDATDTFNGQTPYNEFPAKTNKLAGGYAEVLDAFVFGGFELGEGRKLTARLGQHALQYGESLFFGDNGIARAQGPIDIFKLLSSPNAQFKEIVRPVPQVSAQLQLSPNLSVGGYYQFRWQSDRLPPSGSYFSTANIPWGSGQSEVVGIPTGPTTADNYILTPGADQKAKNNGQFGLQLKWRVEDTDLGFYYAQYHDKSGQLYGNLMNKQVAIIPGQLYGGTWNYVFPENIKTAGFSASQSFGDFNLSAEASVRDNMPLMSGNMLFGFYPNQPQPRYSTGRTAHLNLSTLATFGPSIIARESSLVGEIAWNRVLSKNDPDAELDPARTRDATALQVIYSPSYRQVLPGLDLNVPIGLRYAVAGNSAITGAGWGPKGTGSATLGLDGTYLGVWQFAVNYTHYLGKAVPFVDYSAAGTYGKPIFGLGNNLADRNYVALSVRRTF